MLQPVPARTLADRFNGNLLYPESIRTTHAHMAMSQSRPGRNLKRNLRIGIGEGMLATPWVFLSLPGGFIMTALLTQYFGLGPAVFGIIVSMPAWANAMQLIYLPVIRPFLQPRDMALGLSWLNLGLWLMLVFTLPLLPREDPALSARLFITFFLLASFCSALIGVGWTGWVQMWVPSRIRGIYFGRRNRYIQTTTVCYLLVAMALLHYAGDAIWPYQALILLAVVMRFFSIMWQHCIVTPDLTAGDTPRKGWSRDLIEVWRHRPFRMYIGVMVWIAFWINCSAPFGVVYALEYLQVSKAMFASLVILATLSGALMMPLWGRLVDARGCVRILIVSISLWWATGYTLPLLTPATAWLLYPAWLIGGAMAGGFVIGSFNLLYKVLPLGQLTAGISMHLALTSLAAALGPVIVGFILNLAPAASDLQQLLYRSLFFLATTMILLTGLFARHIPERQGMPPASLTVVGTMRAIRNTMLSVGHAFMANINITLNQRRRRK